MSDERERTEQEVKENNLADMKIVEKYKAAGEISTNALAHVMSLCVAGAKIVDLCIAGDAFITEAAGKVYNKKNIVKGLAHPTCVSLNTLCGYVCPLNGDETALAVGDMIKIDVTAHVDGYVATLAHTVRLGESGLDEKWTGRQADVMSAAYYACEAALRMMKPGNTNEQVTEVIAKAAEEFKCTPMAGVLSHQMERNVFDGEKCILNKPDREQQFQKIDECTIGGSEVYSLDLVMSSGDGKNRESDLRTTVYKRVMDNSYQLRMKASRALYSEIMKNHPTFPFTLRALENEKKARFAISELEGNQLVERYAVGTAAPGEFIGHIKVTVLVMPNGSVVRLTGDKLLDTANLASEHSVTDPALLTVLQRGLGNSKKKKNKKKRKQVKNSEAPALVAAE